MSAFEVAIGRPATEAPQTGGQMSFGLLPQLLGYQLRRTQQAMFRHFSLTVAAEEYITPGLLGMFQVIAANPGLGQSRLAEATGVDRSTIVNVVNQLEGRGLILREPSPTDKRSHCLRLTDEGVVALRRMEALIQRHEEGFTKVLTADEQHFLIRLLTRLSDQDNARSTDSKAATPPCHGGEAGDDVHR
jgi:DNA-binding MarR family transcriptional regulator